MPNSSTPPNPADPEGSVPQPDPTVLTTDALRREIAGLKELVETKLEAEVNLTAERFRTVDVLMERAEEQRREQKQDTKAAVDAALQSQKEATTKMEGSVSDQLSSLRTNFETSLAAVGTSVGDLKERITKLESVKQGQAEQRTEGRQTSAGVYAAIGVGITVLLAILAVIGFISTYGGA